MPPLSDPCGDAFKTTLDNKYIMKGCFGEKNAQQTQNDMDQLQDIGAVSIVLLHGHAVICRTPPSHASDRMHAARINL